MRGSLSNELLEQFPRPTVFGRRVAGIDVNQPRIQAVVNSVIALSVNEGGFRVSELRAKWALRAPTPFGKPAMT